MNQCIFYGTTCSAKGVWDAGVFYPGKSKAEATAQAHAIRELSSHHGTDRRCTGCDQFQHVRDTFWEVAIPGGRIDILVTQADPYVDLYEVKRWGFDPFTQLDRYQATLETMGIGALRGTELLSWAVKYKIDGVDHVAWQDEPGAVWYSPVPDDEEERRQYPELEEVYDRARRVEESDPWGENPGLGPIPLPIPVPVPV